MSCFPKLHGLGEAYEELIEIMTVCIYSDYIEDYVLRIMEKDLREISGFAFEEIPPIYKLLLPNGEYFEPLDLDGDHLHLFCRSALNEIVEYFKQQRADVSIMMKACMIFLHT